MKNTKNITLASLFAGLIFLFTAYISHIPIGVGYVHFGDAFIYICACLLPRKYAMMSAMIGAVLADIATGGVVWALPTMITKPAMAMMFSSVVGRVITKRNLFAGAIAGVFGTLAYFIFEVVMFGNFGVAVANLPAGFIQPIGSYVCFVLIGEAIDTAKRRVS